MPNTSPKAKPAPFSTIERNCLTAQELEDLIRAHREGDKIAGAYLAELKRKEQAKKEPLLNAYSTLQGKIKAGMGFRVFIPLCGAMPSGNASKGALR